MYFHYSPECLKVAVKWLTHTTKIVFVKQAYLRKYVRNKAI